MSTAAMNEPTRSLRREVVTGSVLALIASVLSGGLVGYLTFHDRRVDEAAHVRGLARVYETEFLAYRPRLEQMKKTHRWDPSTLLSSPFRLSQDDMGSIAGHLSSSSFETLQQLQPRLTALTFDKNFPGPLPTRAGELLTHAQVLYVGRALGWLDRSLRALNSLAQTDSRA